MTEIGGKTLTRKISQGKLRMKSKLSQPVTQKNSSCTLLSF